MMGCVEQVVEKRALSMPLPGARPTPLFPEPAAAADSGAPRAKSAPDAYVPSSSSATPASREQASSQGSPFTSLGPMRHSASPTHPRVRHCATREAHFSALSFDHFLCTDGSHGTQV